MEAAPLDRIFTALADPGRRAMVERLCARPASVKELAEPVGMRLPSALKHLRVLEDGGIVVSRKAGRVRTYEISPTAFSIINEWLAERRAAINAAFDRLERAIAEFPEENEE
ncbi:metalloregulator ArsR/SmtB family transcription factor [Sinorhizobium numidicum]|uniref:Metalloregulator ArsR/SmtB family transcription factor n=1 Tax=Sinorhizobium numidicum TaxID=680248 RepID=A0ABY8D133_9HYPH|nr:metalloregulator ArsR/SmtB family transcription factor [Sinorhizobium numidicum]WEX76197.1 metalloregulator ArsR/SmtB family transcription factor [Sinorhizobium numidicum]WEX82856.1 metalloregulator ArsR/SmtB family transcription factor [Sinorhizobium numidicum]